MRNLIFLTFVFIIIFSKSMLAQIDTVSTSGNCVDFFLINSLNPKKKIKLKSNSGILYSRLSLTCDAISTDTSIISSARKYDNLNLIRIDDKNLIFNYQEEQFDYSTNSDQFTDYINYSNSKKMTLDLGDLKEVRYIKSTPNTLSNIGYFTLSTCFLTSAIIAPLISINYKNGDFNKDIYYKVALSGLIGAGVSIPLLITGKPKKYKMTQYGDAKDKELWYLEMHNKKDPSKK